MLLLIFISIVGQEKGNTSLANGKLAEAVDYYTKALKILDLDAMQRAVLLSNRAHAYTQQGIHILS